MLLRKEPIPRAAMLPLWDPYFLGACALHVTAHWGGCLHQNICMTSIRALLCTQEEAQAKARKHLQRALQIYRQVLSAQPGNAYAANGVGAVLAELGDIGTAQRVFREVRGQGCSPDPTRGRLQSCVGLSHVSWMWGIYLMAYWLPAVRACPLLPSRSLLLHPSQLFLAAGVAHVLARRGREEPGWKCSLTKGLQGGQRPGFLVCWRSAGAPGARKRERIPAAARRGAQHGQHVPGHGAPGGCRTGARSLLSPPESCVYFGSDSRPAASPPHIVSHVWRTAPVGLNSAWSSYDSMHSQLLLASVSMGGSRRARRAGIGFTGMWAHLHATLLPRARPDMRPKGVLSATRGRYAA